MERPVDQRERAEKAAKTWIVKASVQVKEVSLVSQADAFLAELASTQLNEYMASSNIFDSPFDSLIELTKIPTRCFLL